MTAHLLSEPRSPIHAGMSERLRAACAVAIEAGGVAAGALPGSLQHQRLVQGPPGLPDRSRRPGREAHHRTPWRALPRGCVHRRGGRRHGQRQGLGDRPHRRHLEFRARHRALLRVDRLRRRRGARPSVSSDDPVLRELFAAERGSGAWLNGEPMKVSGTDRSAPLVSGVRLEHAQADRGLHRADGPRRRNGLGPLSLRLGRAWHGRCRGRRIDGYVELHINSWDVLAGIVLVEEAGGVVNDFMAGNYLANGNPVLACTPALVGCLGSRLELQCRFREHVDARRGWPQR